MIQNEWLPPLFNLVSEVLVKTVRCETNKNNGKYETNICK